jgi:hypothetical protein
VATTVQAQVGVRSLFGSVRRIIDAATQSGAINSGDFCYDTGSGVASFGNGPITFNAAFIALLNKCVGISKDTNPLPPASGITNPIVYAGILNEGEFQIANTTAADTISENDQLTIGADAQTLIKVANYVPAAPTVSASGASGVFPGGAGAYNVGLTWISLAGESTLGAVNSVTITGTQGISVTPPAFPSWAIACNVYVQAPAPAGLAYLLAGTMFNVTPVVFNNYTTAAAKVPPLMHFATIAVAKLPIGTTSVSGGSGVPVNVALAPKWPVAAPIQ